MENREQPAHIAKLDVPTAPHLEFVRNFAETVVCELKFPTLLEVPRTAVERFRRATRHELPHYETTSPVTVAIGGPFAGQSKSETYHRFDTKRKDISVTLKPDAVSIETRRYQSYVEFRGLLEVVLREALPIIDSDFFTRLGLRYVNEVPFPDADLRRLPAWVNPILLGALPEGTFGSVSHVFQEIRGPLEAGDYVFRHGIPATRAGGNPPQYVLDYDLFAETVEAADVLPRVDQFHAQVNGFFVWSLGPQALEYLRGTRSDITAD